MSVPDRSAIVRDVHARFPQLLRHNTAQACGEFLQRCVAALHREHPDERWGLLSKSVGERHVTFPNGQRVAVDVLALPDGNRVDVINGSDNHPSPAGPAWSPIPEFGPDGTPLWRPSNVYVDARDWPIFDSGTPGSGAVTRAKLGVGWFCAIRALREWPEEARANWAWIMEHLRPEYVRVFLDVEGLAHGNPDPWRDAGVDIRSASWGDDYRRAMAFFASYGVRLLCTFYGGRYHAQTLEQQQRNHDRFVVATGNDWNQIELVEAANEYDVNRWQASEVRTITRDLRSKIPSSVPMTLSAPGLGLNRDASNEDMRTAIALLYEGFEQPPYELTVHLFRDPASKWSDPFAYNPLSPLKKYNGEPRGPGASTGGDVADPSALLADYVRTSEAGWTRYTTHCAWSVFNGRLPDEYKRPYDVTHIWDHANMEAICHALRDYRYEGSTTPAPTPLPPVVKSVLKPGESLHVGQGLTNGQWTLQYQGDGNLVRYGPSGPTWASHTDGTVPGSVEMQESDGNFVIYDGSGHAVWHAQTHGHPGASLSLGGDGKLQVMAPIWDADAPQRTPDPEPPAQELGDVEIWLAPNVHSDFPRLVSEPDAWSRVSHNLSAYQCYSGQIPEHAATFAALNLPIAVEIESVKEWDCSGKTQWARWQERYQQLLAATPWIDYVALDSPFVAHACDPANSRAIVAEHIRGIRTLGPEVGVIAAYPDYAPDGHVAYGRASDHIGQIRDLGERRAVPDFWHLDIDRFGIRDNGIPDEVVANELRAIRDECREAAIDFGVIVMGGRSQTAQEFSAYAREFVTWIRRLLGGDPDRWIVQSWREVPSVDNRTLPHNLPESDDTSLTGIVRWLLD